MICCWKEVLSNVSNDFVQEDLLIRVDPCSTSTIDERHHIEQSNCQLVTLRVKHRRLLV